MGRVGDQGAALPVCRFGSRAGRQADRSPPERKEEYPDPDEFYSAIGEQLGITEHAWRAAEEKHGWKKNDGRQTFAILKGGPMTAGGQGSWDVVFIRSAIDPDAKKPGRSSVERVMVQIDAVVLQDEVAAAGLEPATPGL